MLFLSLPRLECVESSADGIELRLDLFEHLDLNAISNFLQSCPYPVLLTLRSYKHEALTRTLLDLEPAFFDLEHDMRPEFLQNVIKSYPKTKFILSYHNFHKTPQNLEQIYRSMQRYAAFSYKIAALVHSTNEALAMLLFGKQYPDLSVICMGEKGQFARVLGKVAGNPIDYASLEQQTALGQLTLSEMIDIYHYSSLNEQTEIYGLIGDPVDKSPGHHYHNQVFREKGINAVYVKMVVKAEELTEFLSLATEMGIKGLSVTMPLKEKILSFVQERESAVKRIGAANTLLFKNGKIFAVNTDGQGALDALEKRCSVRGKKIVLLGAGGAARAIAFEAKRRGADVVVLNRTLERAKKLAADLGCLASDELPSEYDILINCSAAPLSIDLQKIKPQIVVMDIVNGEEMFLNQAAKQTAFWIKR